ncbi:hypothetical protein [Vitiosangium sp. GDMCC 1.1324]|uniref:hypothetical protein n=1 Tax=Vitiosangium sp. (strain GDMCC 1.1324) TaxID=2138576 RepID=UPI000D34DE5C|nr:hypothetical protein [Vitiosangium sp. GDMCC 1.1324]PTL79186.1 hypothetical protein DAT35_36410 [Vitiosangium sp. GDMCC 1.1324]
MALHHSLNNIGATLSTVGHVADTAGPKGYPPSLLAANTYTDGDPFSLQGARSAVLTVMSGTASGGPTAQNHVFTLETAPAGTAADGAAWKEYPGATVSLTGDEKSARKDFSLGMLPEGHSIGRVKLVLGFTGGSSPRQAVSAHVTLGGYEALPVAQ